MKTMNDTDAGIITLPSGKLWGAFAFQAPPVRGTRVLWSIGENIPGTVLGEIIVETYIHAHVQLDYAPTFWNSDQWHREVTLDDLPLIDAAGVELRPHSEPRPEFGKLPPFEMLRACMEARRIVGRKWKEAVRQAWFDGNYRRNGLELYSSPLQRLRNLQEQPRINGRLPWFELDFTLPLPADRWEAPRSERRR
jgi:hypothetical protein